jgi:hypothetical protein
VRADLAPTLHQINELLDKRLEIARIGLDELRRQVLRGETEKAEIILDKLDEDLHMLNRRMRREVEKVVPPNWDGAQESGRGTPCRSR